MNLVGEKYILKGIIVLVGEKYPQRYYCFQWLEMLFSLSFIQLMWNKVFNLEY